MSRKYRLQRRDGGSVQCPAILRTLLLVKDLLPSKDRAIGSGDAESGDAAKEAIERKLGCVSGAAAPTTDDNGSRAYPGERRCSACRTRTKSN